MAIQMAMKYNNIFHPKAFQSIPTFSVNFVYPHADIGTQFLNFNTYTWPQLIVFFPNSIEISSGNAFKIFIPRGLCKTYFTFKFC
jgi:hypothetical protein